MKINWPKKQQMNIEEWHWRYAWYPIRVSADHVVWLEPYYCRCVHVAEGCWAGGDQWQWEYIEHGGSPPAWRGRLICD